MEKTLGCSRPHRSWSSLPSQRLNVWSNTRIRTVNRTMTIFMRSDCWPTCGGNAGDDPRRSASGLMGAVENLIIASRTKMPDLRNRTWLGDAGVESLWHGAIETAVREFTDYLTSQYGQDEHEHAAVLADGLARHLNTTNAIVSRLRQKQALPLFVNASVRRLPKTAPGDFAQEGGPGGIQADLGMLMTCDVPGMMKAQRLTLIQAKKLRRVEGPERWGTGFPFKGKEYTQLERLLLLSQQAHYLFFISPYLGMSALVSAGIHREGLLQVGSNPVCSTVRCEGKCGVAIADFMLHGIIGLWTGDENEANRQMQRGLRNRPRPANHD